MTEWITANNKNNDKNNSNEVFVKKIKPSPVTALSKEALQPKSSELRFASRSSIVTQCRDRILQHQKPMQLRMRAHVYQTQHGSRADAFP